MSRIVIEELQRDTDVAMGRLAGAGGIPAERLELIQAYRGMGLEFGSEFQAYEERVAVAERLGLRRLGVRDAVSLMMGEAHDDEKGWGQRQAWSWFFDHRYPDRDPKGPENSWGGVPTAFCKRRSVSAFSGDEKPVKWCVVLGKPNHLRRKIPPGVVLRMGELAKLRLFNCFSILAPEAMWTDAPSTQPDPILLAQIARIGLNDAGKMTFLDWTGFFVARWDEKEA